MYTTYKNTVVPHGCHIHAKAADMANATICTYPQSDDEISHWKCVLGAVPTVLISILITKKQLKKHEETTPSIRFHIYHIIRRCTDHGRITLKDKKICRMCEQ